MTLRDLAAMAEAKSRHDWSIASSQMCLLAQVNSKRRFTPAEFNPWCKNRGDIPGSFDDLKIFVRMQNGSVGG